MEELQNKDSFASKFFENEFFFMNQKYLCSPKRNRDLAAAFDLINLGDLNSHKNIVVSALDIFYDLYKYKSKIFSTDISISFLLIKENNSFLIKSDLNFFSSLLSKLSVRITLHP